MGNMPRDGQKKAPERPPGSVAVQKSRNQELVGSTVLDTFHKFHLHLCNTSKVKSEIRQVFGSRFGIKDGYL